MSFTQELQEMTKELGISTIKDKLNLMAVTELAETARIGFDDNDYHNKLSAAHYKHAVELRSQGQKEDAKLHDIAGAKHANASKKMSVQNIHAAKLASSVANKADLMEEVEQLDELSGSTLQAHSAARRAQGMKMNPHKDKEEMKSAFASADKSKFRHMDSPDKVTKVETKPYELTDKEKETEAKRKQDAETEMKTKGYGIRSRYYGD